MNNVIKNLQQTTQTQIDTHRGDIQTEIHRHTFIDTHRRDIQTEIHRHRQKHTFIDTHRRDI